MTLLPSLVATGLLSIGLGASPAVGYDASLRSDARVSSYLPEGVSGATTSALELQPRLAITGETRSSSATLTYFPLFTWSDDPSRAREAWLHLATLGGSWRPDEAWTLGATARATRGTIDMLLQPFPQVAPGEQPPVAQTAPALTTIAYQQYGLGLESETRITPRLALHSAIGAGRDGGIGATALEAMPVEQRGNASLGLDWRASHIDTVTAALTSFLYHYVDMPLAEVGQAGAATHASWSTWTGSLTGGWRRDLGPKTQTWANAGLALAGGGGPGQSRLQALPAAELGLSHAPQLKDQLLSGGAVVALAPINDRIRGAVLERTDLRAYLRWSPTRRWSFQGSASSGLVVSGGSRGDWIGYADARVGWSALESVEFSVGLRGSLQDQPRIVGTRTAEWSASLAMTLVKRGRL